jgi:FkbM family methyltransferase
MRSLLKNITLRFAPAALLLWLKRRHYVHALENFDELQEKDLSIVKKLVNKGDFAVDIGANVGWYTKALADRVGKDGRVYSIEPIPPTFGLLQHGVGVFGLDNVDLHQIGLSDMEGVVNMEVPAYQEGGANFYMARIVADDVERMPGSAETFTVTVRSLDSVISTLRDRIAFIKCDVEGHELPVILGATAITDQSHPAWMIEISGDIDDTQSDANKLVTHLLGRGYKVYWFDGARLVTRTAGHRGVNYFFLMPGHVAMLAEKGVEFIG